jgi:hypothetical protein
MLGYGAVTPAIMLILFNRGTQTGPCEVSYSRYR